MLADPLIPSLDAIICAVPADAPFAIPSLLTDATAGSLLFHVTDWSATALPSSSLTMAMNRIDSPSGNVS